MAGNIVKWWKHKILGGYKQFTVLQECATDSEELIYPVRAPSACSAPPDLLLTSDREQMMKVKGGSKAQSHQHQHHQQQQQSSHHQSSQQQSLGHHNHTKSSGGGGGQHNGKDAFRKCSGKTATVKSDPDRVRLEEFTCDVSLEDGKKPQPLQFSFTLYDLDGHGKITKDDIAGIVSTIYESIGKSVVVPHYGSKTINVRLTVSPGGKSKSSAAAVTKKAAITPRRRYRPRKLLSDDDGSDTSENCPRVAAMRGRANTVVANTNVTTATRNNNNNNNNVKAKESSSGKGGEDVVDGPATGLSKSSEAVETTFHNNLKGKNLNAKNEHIYESITNLKCCNLQTAAAAKSNLQSPATTTALNNSATSTTMTALICQDCSLDRCAIDETLPLGTVVIPAATSAAVAATAAAVSRAKRKVVRKSRSSRKATKLAEDFSRPRVRSLSVGNENCYENMMIDNTQEECWKSSACRRELIEIIRDSMVKNSLCFQPNRKPMENSPKHRHRSHTISARVGGSGDQPCMIGTEQALVVAAHETNLCGYDSYLHQTICAAAHGGVVANGGVFTALPVTTVAQNRLLQHHAAHIKAKRKEHRLAVTNRTHQAGHPVKLSTALLNQQYPNLSAEQKLTRSINQVEKWLDNRSPKLVNKLKLVEEMAERGPRSGALKLKRSKSKEDITPRAAKLDNVLAADLLLENLKITEDIAELSVVTPKKVFNKECLISSATKKNIRTHHTTKTISTTTALPSPTAEKPAEKNLIQLQYASIPVNADPSECENLIRISDAEEDFPLPQQQQQQQHPTPQQQPQSCASTPTHTRAAGSVLGGNSGSSASAASTTAVHRYVHEHIHHHYHHFENDPDES